MTDDHITDLKTYMATILVQQVGGLRTDIEQKLDKMSKQIVAVDKKIDDLSDSVGEALHNFDTTTHDQLQNHETRLTTLESAA